MFRAGTWPVCLLVLAIVPAVGGCSAAARRSAYVTVQSELIRNRTEARHCNDRGIAAAQLGNLGDAEKLFRDSLKHDLTYPAAHNNLGLVLLSQRRYYEAAWEFAYATRLDGQSVEPLLNLGRLYETIGNKYQATRQYELALALDPSNAEAGIRLRRLETGKGESSHPIEKSAPDLVWRAP